MTCEGHPACQPALHCRSPRTRLLEQRAHPKAQYRLQTVAARAMAQQRAARKRAESMRLQLMQRTPKR